jgi:acyl carrier protein
MERNAPGSVCPGSGPGICAWNAAVRPGGPVSRAQELEVAQTIVDALNLEDIRAEGIDPEEPLFRDGLGLDSIDALEIALAISMKYGFQIRSDDNDNSRIFASLRSLSHHVEENRVK